MADSGNVAGCSSRCSLAASKRITSGATGAIGLFQYAFRKKFFPISMDSDAAENQGLSIRFGISFFCGSFGFVVTSPVAIAGVLLVFCYLIVPSVGAMLYAKRIGRRLAIGRFSNGGDDRVHLWSDIDFDGIVPRRGAAGGGVDLAPWPAASSRWAAPDPC